MLAELRFFTAREMQSKVAALTGYIEPAFVTFERIIGILDPETGRRIPELLSPASVLALRTIASALAVRLIKRELFLENEARKIFKDVDLSQPLRPNQLQEFLQRLSAEWFEFALSDEALEILGLRFTELQTKNDVLFACTDLLATLLQHAGLYVY